MPHVIIYYFAGTEPAGHCGERTKQTIYLTLPKKDYVEPSTEEVVIEENTGIMQNIIDFITNIF